MPVDARRLMVIVTDRLSVLARKGEIHPRYYNPGDLFEEVHIVMTNDDIIQPEAIQRTVGTAIPYVHNLPAGKALFFSSLGYRPPLLDRWATDGVRLAKQINPDLIRCHGNSVNAYLAVRVKKELGIPLVVSMHANPDIDVRGPFARSLARKIYGEAHKSVEKAALKSADHFIAVYSPIIPYLRNNRVRAYSLVFNAVGYGSEMKKDYRLHQPVRCLCVGRQDAREKDPTQIIEAIAELPGVHLTLVGTGNLHEKLKTLAATLNCSDRCEFVSGLDNEAVLKLMQDSDIYVFNLISLGISKTMMEAALIGLPIIVNRGPYGLAEEIDGDWLVKTENTKLGYVKALQSLIEDSVGREALGRRAHEHASTHWSPVAMEDRVVALYRRYLGQR